MKGHVSKFCLCSDRSVSTMCQIKLVQSLSTSFYLAVLNSYASTKCLTSLTNEEMLIFGMPTQS
jgi:hypothetical protein